MVLNMMPFIVHCERIRQRQAYYLRFPVNDQLIQRIKNLPEDSRKWNAGMMCWEVSTSSLFALIKRYKGSTKIHFDFGNEESRKIFIEQIKKIEIREEEKRKFIADLNIKKEHWVKYKQELEETYVDYNEKCHSFLRPEIKLYPHQITAALFMNVTRNTLISHEMGLGKTGSAILYAEMNGFEKVFIITPNSLKFNFYYEVKKFTNSTVHIVNWKKNDCGIEDAKYVIVNYDFFNPTNKDKFLTKWKKLGINVIDAVICDECFTYNTLVDTDKGQLRIGEIVTKRLGVNVLSYNHKLKKIESKPISRYLYNGYKDVIEVKFSDGEVIECTPVHKFYSVDDDKYKKIKDFRHGERLYKKKKENIYENDNLFELQERVQTKEKHPKILFKGLFRKIYVGRKREEGIENQRGKRTFGGKRKKNLSGLWKGVFCSKNLEETLLQYKLFGKMENETYGYKREGAQSNNVSENIEKAYPSISKESQSLDRNFRKDENGQSNVQTRKFEKNERKNDWSNILIKRWQWAINKATNQTFFSIVGNNKFKNENGIFDTNQKTITGNESRCDFTTDPLYDRYRDSRNKISNRNRWEISQKKEMEILRQEEDRDIEIVWVESIEILESRDRRRFGKGGEQNKKVFDLEILDNHNYFANGVLVSNCQKLKNTKANTYKNFKSIFGKRIFRNEKISKIFLSGTPAPNRAYELYTILNQISPTDFATKKYFYEYYCGMTYDLGDGWGYVANSMEQKFEELYHKIAPFTHRKRKFEVLTDLPDKTYQRIILEMTDNEQRIYDQIEAGVANEFVEHPNGNPLTIMIRLRQYLAQIKVKHVIDLVENVFETGEKVVVVDYFKDSLYELNKQLGEITALHTGDQSIEERADIVKAFQDPKSNLKGFLGSIQTCNYGLTLTAASKLFIITLPYSVGEYDQISDRCILKGELVLTKNGYVPIENIEISDYVLSHKGNWQRVTNISNKIERNKTFYDIKYKGFYEPLRCTSDHKIYVYDKKKNEYSWVVAMNLNMFNHYIVFPKFNINNYSNEFIVESYESKKNNKKNINLNPSLSNDLLYAFGRFVGDGYTNNHQVSICGHIDEYDEVLFSMNSINKEFNLTGITEYRRENKIEMYISSIELRNNFRKWFGDGAYDKKIPDFIFHLSKTQIRYFLNGYYGADGYVRENSQQASTVSKYLSFQLVLLESLMGNCPTLRFNNDAKCWSFEYSLSNKIRRKTLIINRDGMVMFPIQEIKQYKPKRNDERVYDLTIENDESFVVGLSTVHNCHRIGQKSAVNIYPLIFPDTIDDYVFSAIESKRKEIVKVIDNEDYTSNVSESVLGEVIDRIKKKHGKDLRKE